jgi:beta-phosphoglucomutase-like phosphatase (HAD superfamily)
VVLEDSLAGVAAARAAGMRVVALPDAAMDRTRYTEAHHVIASYADLSLADLGL